MDKYYWDTCVFMAWLKDEKPPHRTVYEVAGIQNTVEKVENGSAILVTSTITIAELLESKLRPANSDLFFQFMQKRRVSVIAADIIVARYAKNIRDQFFDDSETPNEKTISTPDSLHLATGVIHKVTEFHTFDGKNNKNSIGLLQLDNRPELNKLRICKPVASQASLSV